MSRSAVKAGSAYIELNIRNRIAKGAKKAKQDLQNIGRSALQMGGMVGGLGLAISAPITHAALSFAEFDDAMLATRGVTQASDKDFQMLTDTAKELGRTTSFTAVEVAGLMTELGRAGFKPDQINEMTNSVLALSRATGTDASLSAGIMASTIRQYSLEAGDAARVSDVLTAAANNSFNSVESLGEALKYAGPVAADLGMSLEETAAILGTLGNLGIQGSEAGTALRRLSVLGAAEADKLQKIFGVAFRDAAGNALPLVDTLDKVAEATNGMGSGERAEKFSEAFGLLGITAANAISKTASQTGDLLKVIKDSAGVAEATATEMDSGLGGSVRKLGSAYEGLKLAIGDAVEGPMQSFVDRTALAAGIVTEFISKNQNLIITVATVAGGLVGLGAAATLLGVSAYAAAAAIGVTTTAAGLLASPLMLSIAAASGLGAVLATQTQIGADSVDWLASRFEPLVGTVGDAMTAIKAAIEEGDFSKAWDLAVDLMEVTWLDLGGTIQDTWGDAMNYVLDIGTSTAEGIGEIFKALAGILGGMLDAYKSYYDSVYNFTSDKLNDMGESLTGVETIGAPAPKQSAFEDKFGGVENRLRDSIDSVREFGENIKTEATGQKEDRHRETAENREQRAKRIEEIQGNMRKEAAAAESPQTLLSGFAPLLQAGITAGIAGAGSLGITTDDMTDLGKLTEKLSGVGEKAKSLLGIEDDPKRTVNERFNTVAEQSASVMPTSVSSGFAAALLGASSVQKPEQRVAKNTERMVRLQADANRKLDQVGKWA